MKNFIQEGVLLDVTPGADLASGAGFLLGAGATGFLGVASSAIASGTLGSVRVRGVFELPKLSTDVFAVGTPLYWDDTNKRLTVTAGAHSLVGWAVEAAANPTSTGKILLKL